MHIILLSGGSGSRLWPLSNTVRSKQFLKVLRGPDGEPESMVQRVYRQIRENHITDSVTIATSEAQTVAITKQLGENVNLVVEPERRNTFPAIALAGMYLHSEKKASMEDVVIVMPVDVYAENTYFQLFKSMEKVVLEKSADLVLMGIHPAGPSEKFGYMIPFGRGTGDGEIKIHAFEEKPEKTRAQELIDRGAMWNGGVFAFRLGWLLEKLPEYTTAASYDDLRTGYQTLTKNSFDYEIVEKSSNIWAVEYKGIWQDLGTWDALTDKMEEPNSGKVLADLCENTHVINELDIPLIALNLKDTVVCATPDGILVADKEVSGSIKKYTDFEQRPMYEKRFWGEYKVLDYVQYGDNEKSLTKHLMIENQKYISYQRHLHRREVWTVVNGEGEVILDGVRKKVKKGDVIQVEKGMKHTIRGEKNLHIVEVQIGSELTEEDIERFESVWE